MTLSRRQLLGTLGVLGAVGAGAMSWSRRQKPASSAGGICPALTGQRVRWIVPHAAGGGYDAESRLVEPFLERRLGAEIVIENMPGAGGITGARSIVSARPDGKTIGIVGAPGLLIAKLTEGAAPSNAEGTHALDPAAFTILGRISRSWHVWATGRDSPLKTIDDALAAARRKPLVFALSEVAGVNFVSAGVTASLLGAPITLVPGFQGSQAAALAAIRGDVDLVSYDFEAIRGLIAAGELRPLLQVSDRPVDAHASLAGVPVLGGPEGWVARHPRGGATDVTRDAEMTTALIEVVSSGRIVVAPPGLAPAMAGCLGQALHETLMSPELRAVATRTLDVATSDVARADVLAAARDLSTLLEPLQAALAAVRG